MSLTALTFFVLGLAALVAGAELLVRGSSRLAAAVGISPLVIGLTVVAFGTSAPELAVSVQASIAGQPDLALGNVVGSNIFNVLFILGISALIVPLVVSQQLLKFDVPVMIGVSLLLFVMGLDGKLSRLDGVALLAGIIAYTVFSIRQSRKESNTVKEEYAKEFGNGRFARQLVIQIVLIIGGLALLVVGSRWLVGGAVALAKTLGVSELVIALTVVAAGTSLPELATSIVAAVRGERDIAVGNVIGSNIFNILCILGLSGIVATDGLRVSPAALWFDMPVMMAVAIACLPIFFTGGGIARWEGALFLGYYVAYTLYLILDAAQHGALSNFRLAMSLFVLPLTAVTLMVLIVRTARANRQATGKRDLTVTEKENDA